MTGVDVGALAAQRRAQIVDPELLSDEQSDRRKRLMVTVRMLDAVEQRLRSDT